MPYVFPSGNHNRFEHTLGTAVISEMLVDSLFRKIRFDNSIAPYKNIEGLGYNYIFNHVRIAAIMHDCGHGPFSHVSERIFRTYDDLEKEKNTNKKLSGASKHEILSYLIVTSSAFKSFFDEHITRTYGVDIDLDFIGEIIVGFVNEPHKAFIVEAINGSFDADKLDYIQRDSHFTGIRMVLDLHRLFHTIDVIVDDEGKYRLSVDLSGVSTLEQIVFNKMMLFSTIYHHQKVRAAECLLRDIFRIAKESKKGISNRSLDSAADFLHLTDTDFLNIINSEDKDTPIAKLAFNLFNRVLPKRAAVISIKTIDSGRENLEETLRDFESEEYVENFREAISEETKNLGVYVSPADIWIDMPHGPKFKEPDMCPIKSSGEKSGYLLLRHVFPVNDWVRAFTENKWKGYVFCWPEHKSVVHQ